MKKSLLEELTRLGELQEESENEYKQECIQFWESLSDDEKLKVFYVVTSKLTQGELLENRTYRYILYDIFKFGMESYHVGVMSGFMALHNSIHKNTPKEVFEPKKDKFQYRVNDWLIDCFGEDIAKNKKIRSHRFIEESLELVQSCGCDKQDVLRIVDYVYGRDTGVVDQEVGGVAVTLGALCMAQGIDLETCAETELQRVKNNIDHIRQKSKMKPDFSSK